MHIFHLNMIFVRQEKKQLIVKYDEQGIIVSDYQSKISQFNTEIVIMFLEDMILDYIS